MDSETITIGSLRGQWASRQQIGYLMQQGVDFPNCLSLAAGLVDDRTLPLERVQQSLDRILSDGRKGRQALQYGTTPGSLSFRQVLIEQLAQLDGSTPAQMGLTTERCLVTTGSQQFLDLITQALFNPGDVCLVTAPTYFVYLSTLEAAGVQCVPVACDESGLIPAALEESLERLEQAGQLPRVKMLYLVSYFDNPCGTTLPEDRRLTILEILQRWTSRQFIYLLEDAAYRELWFEEPPPRSLLALDTSRERVIFTQTFSKSLSPGLRTGWGILPERLVKPMTDLKSVHDFGSPHLAQFVIEDLIRSGEYAEHVAGLRDSYRRKAQVFWQALEQEIFTQPGMHAMKPEGGLYVWLKIEASGENSRFTGPLFDRCVRREHVMFVPGELFYADRSATDASCTMRLSFGVQSEENLIEGARRLARAMAEK